MGSIDLLCLSLLLKSKKFVLNTSMCVNRKQAEGEREKYMVTQEKIDSDEKTVMCFIHYTLSGRSPLATFKCSVIISWRLL